MIFVFGILLFFQVVPDVELYFGSLTDSLDDGLVLTRDIASRLFVLAASHRIDDVWRDIWPCLIRVRPTVRIIPSRNGGMLRGKL